MPKLTLRFFSALLLAIASTLAVATEEGVRRDARALKVIEAMRDYKSGLEAFRISGSSSTDGRLPAGLIVANTEEVMVTVQRPGSMHFKAFDGIETRQLWLKDGALAVYSDQANAYAQATVPAGLDASLQAALEDYDIDLPLMDMVDAEAFGERLEPGDVVMYLGDKRLVRGVDCHQIAIRGKELDVQLWIQEGKQPLVRKIVLTSKWDGGAPRFIAEMDWDTSPRIHTSQFIFKAPKDAARIQFVNAPAE